MLNAGRHVTILACTLSVLEAQCSFTDPSPRHDTVRVHSMVRAGGTAKFCEEDPLHAL